MSKEQSVMDMLKEDRGVDEKVDTPSEEYFTTPEEQDKAVIINEPEEEISFADTGNVEEEVIPSPSIKQEVEKKPSTEPWTQTGNPWAIDVLALKFKHIGFRPRFVPSSMISTRKDQGWIMASCKDYNIELTPGQGNTFIKRKGLFLMEIPEHLAKQREAFFKRKVELQSSDARQKEVTQARRMGKQVGVDLDIKDIR